LGRGDSELSGYGTYDVRVFSSLGEQTSFPKAAQASKIIAMSDSPPRQETQLSSEEIYRLIREAAYRKAEARNFAPGVELQDWLEAEKEVLASLGKR